MSHQKTPTKAGRQYAEAHAAHYTEKKLHEALELYRAIVTEYPETREAHDSRSQIKNIVESVLPPQALLNAQIDLLLDYFERDKERLEASPTAPS